MDDREGSPFARVQPSRSMIRAQAAARKLLAPSPPTRQQQQQQQQQMANRPVGEQPEVTSPGTSKRPSHAPLEALKQWELVEDGKGLQVVEKRAAGPLSPVRPAKELPMPVASPIYGRAPLSGRKLVGQAAESATLEEKLRGLDESKIGQPMRRSHTGGQHREHAPAESKAPLSLDLILKQQQQQRQRSPTIESTDMLQRLEQQVKAIEMGTIAARTTRQLENSADFGPEVVQLRYREHEDLLRNVTDDEAEG